MALGYHGCSASSFNKEFIATLIDGIKVAKSAGWQLFVT
jgi:hypothetical protein